MSDRPAPESDGDAHGAEHGGRREAPSAADAVAHRMAQVIALGFGCLLMFGLGVFHAASVLVVPLWAALLLDLEWLGLVLLMWRWRDRPYRVLALPMASAATWWLVLTAGDAWLGWTA